MRDTIEAVLIDGVVDALGEVALEFGGRDWDAVEEKDEVDRVLVLERVADLANDAEAVLPVAGEDLRVRGEGRLELGELERLLEADELDPVPKDVEGPAEIELVAEALEDGLRRFGAVVLGEDFPGFGLRLLNPREQVFREDGPRAVVLGGVPFRVEPPVFGEVFADLVLEGDLFMEAHATLRSAHPRTSI